MTQRQDNTFNFCLWTPIQIKQGLINWNEKLLNIGQSLKDAEEQIFDHLLRILNWEIDAHLN